MNDDQWLPRQHTLCCAADSVWWQVQKECVASTRRAQNKSIPTAADFLRFQLRVEKDANDQLQLDTQRWGKMKSRETAKASYNMAKLSFKGGYGPPGKLQSNMLFLYYAYALATRSPLQCPVMHFAPPECMIRCTRSVVRRPLSADRQQHCVKLQLRSLQPAGHLLLPALQ